ISKLAKERNEVDRNNFILRMSQYIPSQLVFLDETAYDRRTLSRCYGWNFSGLRARKYTFFVRGRRFTIEGALCINGFLAYCIQEGSMNSIDYENFIEHVLLPKMNPFPEQYSVLVLDNASIHKSQYLRDICEEKAAYSPDFNPLLKNYLRQNRTWAELMEDPFDVLDLVCMTIDYM
ncbi:31008_t:CDS:2, partial [Gigaspora margarita]